MHIEPKDIADYPIYLRWLFKSQQKKLGKVLLPGLFWGRIPFLQILFLFFWKHLDRTKFRINPELRAIIQVRVAQLNSCKFCIDYNSLNLLNRTNTLEKADELADWKNSNLFSTLEKNVLRYVDIVSGLEVSVPGELMELLKNDFNDDQIVEITALIAFQNMSAKFNAALDIPSQGMCKITGKSS